MPRPGPISDDARRQRHSRLRKLICALLVLIIVAPVLYVFTPAYHLSPDLQYIKAKVMWVSRGELFTDPASGFPTFHPPFYHLFLSLFFRLGFGMDAILIATSVAAFALLVLFAYLLIRDLFSPTVALFTVLLIPFINHYLGPNYLLLASAFTCSLPLYLAALWLDLKRPRTTRRSVIAALLYGLAFLLSPGYLFLIGFTFLYGLVFERDFRHRFLMIAVFLVSIIPFFIQASIIYRASMMGTAAFAPWRGLPDFAWLGTMISYFLSPMDGRLTHWQILPAAGVAVLGIVAVARTRPAPALPIIAGLAFLFTAYHYTAQYASRVQFVLALVLAAYAIRYLTEIIRDRHISYGLVLALALFGVVDHTVRTADFYATRATHFAGYDAIVETCLPGVAPFLQPDSFVLATDQTYRDFIMPFFPVHGLVAYRSGEYYQLTTALADEMLADYEEIMGTTNLGAIDQICIKYRINIAIFRRGDDTFPIYRAVNRVWQPVYRDDFFRVYRRPEPVPVPPKEVLRERITGR